MLAWLAAGLVYPSINAILSRLIPANAQGELQGGVASLSSISAITGPPLMTQLFGHFSAAGASIHFPGAAFLFAALLAAGSGVLFLRAGRSRATSSTAQVLSTVAPESNLPQEL